MALEKTSGYINGTAFANEVLAGLKNAGINLSKLVPLSFYLYLPNRKAAGICSPVLVKEGLEVEIDRAASNDGKWLCLCHATLKPNHKDLERIGQTMLNLAQKFEGEFDGWETNPFKMQGGFEDMLGEMLKKLSAN
jgi:hypothetical protein